MNIQYLQVRVFIVGCLALHSFDGKASGIPDAASMKAIAGILSELDSPSKPASAIAILKDGKVIYEKAFGSTNLEHKSPTTVDTTFQVDSLAWEFIAVATLMLEEQGKLKLGDDIRKYLPEIPEFASEVTIRHLLSSTDGMYGYKVLRSLAGWAPGAPMQYKTVFDLIESQKSLNFKAGQAFSPGGQTRLVLLARIVELVSGQSFDEYCRTHLFAPLGMSNTSFVYDGSKVLENTALPYRADGKGGYTIDAGSGSAAGPTNLYTSIRDLSLWRASISSHALGGTSLATTLRTPIRLDDGTVVNDIASISILSQQHVGKERGIPKIYQLGSHGGYRSSYFHFPDQGLSAVVLSSGLAYNGSYGMRVLTVLAQGAFPEPENIDFSKIKAAPVSAQQLQACEGNYWDRSRALPAVIRMKDGGLLYSRAEGGAGQELIPLGDAAFQMKVEGDDKYIVKFIDAGDGKDMHFSMSGSDPVIFKAFRKHEYPEKELMQFAGVFHNRELDSSFAFRVERGMLVAENIRVGSVNFRPIQKDGFAGDKSFMAGIEFKRDGNDAVTGFDIVVDQVRHLEFKKLR